MENMLVGLRGLKNHHHIREPNQGLQTFKPLLGLGKSRKGHGMRHQWSDPLVELVKGMGRVLQLVPVGHQATNPMFVDVCPACSRCGDLHHLT